MVGSAFFPNAIVMRKLAETFAISRDVRGNRSATGTDVIDSNFLELRAA